VLARALAKDPAHRFGSCAELVSAARACWPVRPPASETVVGQQFPPSPPEPRHRTGPPPRRGRLLAGIGAGLAVALAVTVILVLAPWRTEPDASPGLTNSTTPATSSTAAEQPDGGSSAWGDVQFIVDDFPSLLPTTPDAEGWGGGTCAPTAFAGDVHADVGLTCQYANGITAEVAHYPDIAARDARRSELEAADADDSPEGWGTDDTTRAGVRLFSEDSPDFVWQWIMFNQQDKAQYVVVLEWTGHTQAELDEEWFARAPFAGPAGT